MLPLSAAAVAVALVLGGCSSSSHSASHPAGSPSPAGTTAPGAHDQADVTFATDMVPHHAQAVQMADMAAGQATDTRVKALAADIKRAQDPETATMSGWLAAWGRPVPSAAMAGMTGSMSGFLGGSGTGMMSDAGMGRLGAARGAAFDRMWVSMMALHHRGAVAMARTELAQGRYGAARTLAASIVTSQTAQIAQLDGLLARLPG